MTRLCLILFLVLSWVATAQEKIPSFKEITPGLEYREVLLQKPRPLPIIEARIDPARLQFKLLLASDGRHEATATAQQMLERHGLLLAVNSSYFGEQNELLGYARRGSEVLNSEVERESFLTALFGWDGKKAYIIHRDDALPPEAKVLFQCGPRLVWDSRAVAGLEKTRMANRTALAVDAQGRVCLMVMGGFARTTLAELPDLLMAPVEKGGLGAVRAMNLDGGKSTQLCVKDKPVHFLPGFVPVPVYLGVSKP